MLQLFRGDVVTMDAHRPFGTGILAEDGVIREVGEFEALKDRAPGAAVEDYGDAAILPGFIDGHSHLSAVAYESILFDARPESGCRSVEELAAFVDGLDLPEGARRHCSYFARKLELADALAWSGGWRTTASGERGLVSLFADDADEGLSTEGGE